MNKNVPVYNKSGKIIGSAFIESDSKTAINSISCLKEASDVLSVQLSIQDKPTIDLINKELKISPLKINPRIETNL